jgi:hypothetical protein
VKTEPARANQSQPEPARASQSQQEPARATQSHTEPLGATQSQPDEARAQNDGSSTVIPRASARRTTVLLLLYRARLVEHDFENTQSHPEPPRASQSQPEPPRATQSHSEPHRASQTRRARRTTVLLLLYRARPRAERRFFYCYTARALLNRTLKAPRATQSHPEPARANHIRELARGFLAVCFPIITVTLRNVCTWLRVFLHNKGYTKEMSAPWLI